MAVELMIGLEGEANATVTENLTAIAMRSGDVPVLATPALTALMEEAAVAALNAHLDNASTSVGVRIDVRHLAASPVGTQVYTYARLVNVEGKRLTFRVSAYEEPSRAGEALGEGTHERVIVNREKFLARTR